jgi:hypothetical protein
MRRKPKYLDRERRAERSMREFLQRLQTGKPITLTQNLTIPANVNILQGRWPLMKTLD